MREAFALSIDQLRRLAPDADADILAGLAAASSLFDDYGLAGNELRLCHFLAQAAHETGGFATLVERGRASYFARLYGGRADLGNRNAADGARYRGRGLFQLTGRHNYRRYGDLLGIDLEARPELAARPDISLRVALEYWRRHELNHAADANDLRRITRRINGGLNGLARRRALFERARDIFAIGGAGRQAPWRRRGGLRAGDTGPAVSTLQKRLAARGYRLAVDGRFGRATDTALRAFQKAAGLTADGIYGPRSRAALTASADKRRTSFPSKPNKENPMNNWKSYLQSRTIWANLVALAAFGLSVTGVGSITGDSQTQLVDAILRIVEAGGIVSGVFFRAVATQRLGPDML